MYDFGALLKQLRVSKRLTQKRLAEKIDKNKTTVSKYERNLQSPPIETMIDMANIFNVSLDYLAGLSPKNAVSLAGLTDKQAEIIIELSNIFREQRPHDFKGLTKRQLELINNILKEFV